MSDLKFYKVWSEWDIGSEETPNDLFIQTDNINKVHRYLENYCCSVGEDYHECLEDGLFEIKEVTIDQIVLVLG